MADDAPKNPIEPSKPRASHPALLLVLYAFLVAVICFVAYQVRLCVAGRPPTSPRQLNMGAGDFRRSSGPPQSQPWDPARASQSPLSMTNLTRLDKDPIGLAPPPGAKAISGYQQQPPGELQQQRTYDCPGDLETVKSYYVKLLGQEGFATTPGKAAADSVVLNFIKGVNYGILSLRKTPGQVKMVEIRLIVISVVTSD
jgi:hypothetical protein